MVLILKLNGESVGFFVKLRVVLFLSKAVLCPNLKYFLFKAFKNDKKTSIEYNHKSITSYSRIV